MPTTGSPPRQAAEPSVLFADGDGRTPLDDDVPEPDCFADLNLDRIGDALLVGRRSYRLAPYFRTPLRDPDAVAYRHEVFRDLAHEPADKAVRQFASRMRDMRDLLTTAESLPHPHQRDRLFTEAVEAYCAAVTALAADLGAAAPASRALRRLLDHLADLTAAPGFTALTEEARAVDEALGRVRYSVLVKNDRVRVAPYEGEPDYSAEVEHVFARFRRGRAPLGHYRTAFPHGLEMNDVEAQVLELVAKLFPEPFRALAGYRERHRDFLDPGLARFDREVQFYLAYQDFTAPLRQRGLRFTLPEVTAPGDRSLHAAGAFDLALADKLHQEDGPPIVPNDFRLDAPERVLVVTGPNQGGKTTFARTVGQLHYLAALGLPVPAAEARLPLPDGVHTHFEREEDLATLRGKLDDELVRIRAVLDGATSRSVVIMNESFSSTTLRDARYIGEQVLQRLIALDVVCVYVTFVDELASLSPATVSMVTGVVPDDPATRTFRLVRRPADGLAHATAIAEKYSLTYEALRRRLTP